MKRYLFIMVILCLLCCNAVSAEQEQFGLSLEEILMPDVSRAKSQNKMNTYNERIASALERIANALEGKVKK